MLTKQPIQSDSREVIEILMDSRLYYDLTVIERLKLVRHLVCQRNRIR